MPLTAFEMNQPVKPRRAWVVFLFSLVLPGLGQFHAGHPWRGLLWWGAVALAGLVVAFTFRWVWPDFPKAALGIGGALTLQVLGAVDAVRILRRDQHARAEQPLPRLGFYFAYVLGLVALNLAAYEVAPVDASVETFSIGSQSSLPNLLPGDRILAAKAPAHRAVLRRGAYVLYQQEGTVFVHRLVGLPGDVVAMTADGHLSLNGGALTALPDGTYPREYGAPLARFRETLPNADGAESSYPILRDLGRNLYPDTAILVPDGHVFVLGDNRDATRDSRYTGPVPIADIIGLASFIYWPGKGPSGERDWSRIGRSLLPY